MDLERWRAQHVTRQIRKLTLKNAKKTMYKYGSQPPLVLTIGDQFEHLILGMECQGRSFGSECGGTAI